MLTFSHPNLQWSILPSTLEPSKFYHTESWLPSSPLLDATISHTQIHCYHMFKYPHKMLIAKLDSAEDSREGERWRGNRINFPNSRLQLLGSQLGKFFLTQWMRINYRCFSWLDLGTNRHRSTATSTSLFLWNL